MPDQTEVTDELATGGADMDAESVVAVPDDEDDGTQQAGPKDVNEEAFVANLALDEDCLVPVRVFSGYIGESGCGLSWWRLYSSLEFNEYIEFREDDMLGNVKIVDYQGASVGSIQYPDVTRTIVWIEAGARVRYHRLRSHEVESDFLRGEITHEYEAMVDQFGLQSAGGLAEGSGYNPMGAFSSKGPC